MSWGWELKWFWTGLSLDNLPLRVPPEREVHFAAQESVWQLGNYEILTKFGNFRESLESNFLVNLAVSVSIKEGKCLFETLHLCVLMLHVISGGWSVR